MGNPPGGGGFFRSSRMRAQIGPLTPGLPALQCRVQAEELRCRTLQRVRRYKAQIRVSFTFLLFGSC